MSRFSSLITTALALAVGAGTSLPSLPSRSRPQARPDSDQLERIRKAQEKRDRKNAKRMRP